jgi:hypothetical protein
MVPSLASEKIPSDTTGDQSRDLPTSHSSRISKNGEREREREREREGGDNDQKFPSIYISVLFLYLRLLILEVLLRFFLVRMHQARLFACMNLLLVR